MDATLIALSIVSGLLELLKQSHETKTPLTQEQIDKVIADRKAAEAENAQLDPK